MGRYRKIMVSIWDDQWFFDASKEAQLLYLFLRTHPNMTSVGAMRVTLGGLADDIGWLREDVEKAIQELGEQFVQFDPENKCLILPRFMSEGEAPQNPKAILGWAKNLGEIPDCKIKRDYVAFLEDYAKTLSDSFQEAFDTVSKRYRDGIDTVSSTGLRTQDTGLRTPDLRGKKKEPPQIGSRSPVDKPKKKDSKKQKKVLDWNAVDMLEYFQNRHLEYGTDKQPKGKSAALLKSLITDIGAERVHKMVNYLFDNWKALQKKYKIKSGSPSVGILSGFATSIGDDMAGRGAYDPSKRGRPENSMKDPFEKETK